jgi:twitching motility protein PilT
MQGLTKKNKPRIGEILIEYGLITHEQLTKALDRQTDNRWRIGSVLEEMGYLDNDTLLNILSKQYDLPYVNLFDVKVPTDVLRLLLFEQVKSFKVLPFKRSDNVMSLAMVDPVDINAIHNVEFTIGGTVKPFIVPHYQMDKAISRFEKEGYGSELFDGEKLREEKIVTESKIPSIYTLLKRLLDFKATDLHLTAGAPPSMRVKTNLKRLPMPHISPAQMKDFISDILTLEQMEEFEREKELDFVLSLSDIGRFRINIYKQRNSISLSAKLIFENIPSITDLRLPDWMTGYVLKTQGLILIVGPAGHGKTTTRSTLIDIINSNRSCNIVTLEDPIEYLHEHKKSNVNQREVGIDTESFSAGLRHILRQDTDVVVIGDLRDPESIATALNIAETGHLVISTMHTLNATTAIDRVLNIFPEHQQPQIRMQLADTLLLVFAQKLIPGKDNDSRILAFEKLTNSRSVTNLIREGKVFDIRLLMQDESDESFSIERSIASLCLEDKISFEDGLKFADNPSYYEELVRTGKTSR